MNEQMPPQPPEGSPEPPEGSPEPPQDFSEAPPPAPEPPPAAPEPPPASAEPPPAAGQASSTGLDPRLAGLLCYILGLVTGVVFFIIEKTNPVVRFHAAQSIVFCVAAFVAMIALSAVGVVLNTINFALGTLWGLVTMVVWLGVFVLWLLLLLKGYSGEKWKLPYLGDMAERLASKEI